jgi:hypothetical protein
LKMPHKAEAMMKTNAQNNDFVGALRVTGLAATSFELRRVAQSTSTTILATRSTTRTAYESDAGILTNGAL